MTTFKTGDIVYALPNSQYVITHPKRAFFGMVIFPKPNHRGNIAILSLFNCNQYIKMKHIAEMTFSAFPRDLFLEISDFIKMHRQSDTKKLSQLLLENFDAITPNMYQVLPEHFAKVPVHSFEQFAFSYYHEHFSRYFHHSFDLPYFNDNILKYLNFYAINNRLPSPIPPLPFKSNL